MKASEITSGLKDKKDRPNPIRKCRRVLSTTVKPYAKSAVPKTGKTVTIDSGGHKLKKPGQGTGDLKKGHFPKSSEITELKKKAKKLGIDRVNSYDKEELKKLVAEAEGKVKKEAPAEPKVDPPKTEVPSAPTDKPKDEKELLRDKIRELGGDVPKGRCSLNKLKTIVSELEG
jgi:hypothetical protein